MASTTVYFKILVASLCTFHINSVSIKEGKEENKTLRENKGNNYFKNCSIFNISERTYFRAASYEHVPVARYRDGVVSPDDIYAKYIITQNLNAFKEQAVIASLQVYISLLFVFYLYF